MSDDLTERLRNARRDLLTEGIGGPLTDMLREAADTIEALEAERDDTASGRDDE